MSSIIYITNKDTGKTYAYESSSYWDKTAKAPRSHLTYLGRVANDGTIIPKKQKRLSEPERKQTLLKASFLRDKSHDISFVYTPKHSSWLNQIELCFHTLNIGLLKALDSASVEALTQSMCRFISQYNDYFAHSYK